LPRKCGIATFTSDLLGAVAARLDFLVCARTTRRHYQYTEQMTKAQLIEAVAAKTGREKPEIEAVLESVLGTIAEALHTSQRVDLRGFGSFVVKEKKERQGRNPRTGETITIAAKRVASFKVGKELTEKLVQPKTENSVPGC
jgi:nucleoid DNA-binding protein